MFNRLVEPLESLMKVIQTPTPKAAAVKATIGHLHLRAQNPIQINGAPM